MPVSFFSISEVYPPKLKTEEKRLHLTLESVDLYNRAIQDAGLLVPDGALYLVDMHHLTQGGRLQALPESSHCCHQPSSISDMRHAVLSHSQRRRQWAAARMLHAQAQKRGRCKEYSNAMRCEHFHCR